MHISDEISVDLWHSFKAGDAEALGTLSQMHYRALYNYAHKFAHDSDLIRDTIQELFLDLWERRSFLSETAFVKSYLLKALRHKLIKESARHKRYHEFSAPFLDAEPSDSPIEDSIIHDELTQLQNKHLKRVISSLSKRQQEIIYLRFYQNLDNEQIAQVMNLGKQSVANLLSRTLKDIKNIWITTSILFTILYISILQFIKVINE